jgi:hypothetical protein
MRAADLATVGVLLATGALVLWDSVRLGMGWGTDGPKSGFFPFWLALILVGASVAIAVQAARRVGSGPFITREQTTPVLKTLLPAVGVVALMQFVGLYVACTVYLATYMCWIGRYRWWTGAAMGLGFSLVTFVVFERWFLVPLPKGPLENWLGF